MCDSDDVDLTKIDLNNLNTVNVYSCAAKHVLLWPNNVTPVPSRCLTTIKDLTCRNMLVLRKTLIPINVLYKH